VFLKSLAPQLEHSFNTLRSEVLRKITDCYNSGQGGNQSLCDCADALPQILRLHSLHQESPERLTNMEIEKACLAYEQVMIPRAFEWVSKSGGISIPVSQSQWLCP
jgi:hypothetical protein